MSLSLVLAPTALAYEDAGHDADDRTTPGEQEEPDIRSTLRRVAHGEQGRYFLLVVRAYEDFERDLDWVIRARLDTRHGPHADAVLWLRNATLGSEAPGFECALRHMPPRRFDYRLVGRTVRCRFPIRVLDPTKQIRWRLLSPTLAHGEIDRAPDTGWYP